MLTLHRYILAELLRAFALTVLALTGLFTLAGGLVSVMRYEGVTAGSVALVLPLLLPIVITLTMPIAALFAATIVYGRLAADNEFVACSAAGVNIQRLFLPALGLAAVVTLITLVSANFVIPDSLKQIEGFARNNLRDIAFQKLRTKGEVNWRNEFFLTAQSFAKVAEAELASKSFPVGDGLGYIWLTQPTFLQVDPQGQARLFVAADGGLAQFDTRTSNVKVTIYASKARIWELGKSASYVEEQKIGPTPVPRGKPRRASMVDLKTLLAWRAAPWNAERIRPLVTDLLDRYRDYRFISEAAAQLAQAGAVELSDLDGRLCRITADEFRQSGRQLRLAEARVELRDARLAAPFVYRAADAALSAHADVPGESVITLSLYETATQPVLLQDPRAVDYEVPQRRGTTRIDGLRMPAWILDQVAEVTPERLTDPAFALAVDAAAPGAEGLSEKRAELVKQAAREKRKIDSVLHFRMSYAGSSLVTIVMGAALGVIFRGSQALAAFGLASVPFGAVTLLVIMGRRLAEDAGGEAVGAAIIWGGLGAVGLADLLVLWLGVRR